MIKKLASLAGAGALLLGMAVPALGSHLSDDVSIRNRAYIRNWVMTKADTGDNTITASDDVEGGEINTGDAGAASSLLNDVNASEIGDTDGDVRVRNKARVKNYVYTKADTGDNTIVASDDVEGGVIDTGSAGAASVVVNSVNYTATGL